MFKKIVNKTDKSAFGSVASIIILLFVQTGVLHDFSITVILELPFGFQYQSAHYDLAILQKHQGSTGSSKLL